MIAKLIESSTLRNDYRENALRPDFAIFVKKLTEFEATAGEDYFSSFERVELKKGEYLLKEGEVPRYYWIMESGLARLYSFRNGEEITGDFFFTSEFVDLYGCSVMKMPAHANIQLMTDSILYRMEWNRLSELQLKYPMLVLIERLIAASYMRTFELRTFDMIALKAEERYKKLLDAHPYILNQVPINQIASYLGIKLETLSRIRNKLQ